MESPCGDPAADPQLTVERYERTQQQAHDIGLSTGAAPAQEPEAAPIVVRAALIPRHVALGVVVRWGGCAAICRGTSRPRGSLALSVPSVSLACRARARLTPADPHRL